MRVDLLFSAAAGAHLHETPLATDQVVTTQADGRLRVTATVQQTQQLSWWLLGFGAAVEVVAPAPLRQSIQKQLQAAAERYASP